MSRRLVLPLFALLLLVIGVAPVQACPDRDTCDGHAGHAGHGQNETESAETDDANDAIDAKDWDVNVPRGPHATMNFTVEEGTWLSVDVAPDGKSVVFDLLGDLWRVPISGGDATRLSTGMSWDHQPRFSPDGETILFTSDRGGGTNLWTMNADGSDLRAFTDAGEKDTNCGAYSPDGEWVIAKRRLTDASSIGATELWMYHRTGGSGLQITKKSDIPEVSEPVFHPDGRFVYFSARPSRFSYDRNVHQGIYQIRRFDRLTGEVSTVTSRWGGAARPSISPDGELLTFVSRDGLETVLVVHDLQSGAERVLLRGLEHDLQESFAWAGVYPGMDFTPDGRHLILWNEGKLVKVALADGATEEIPFRCEVELPYQEALRFTPDVASESLTLRILRWMHAAPKGDAIVFSAIGRLYVTDADGSNPRLLLRNDDDREFEYAPRFSPDGKQIAYVTWSDLDNGHVWIAGANGRNARRLTTVPGQWVNPTWSADGKELLALRGSGATLRGSDLGDELHHEIHVLDVKTGAATFVTTVPSRGSASRMPAPFFAPDGTRIFFMRSGAENKTELVSVRRDGTDAKVHVSVQYGEEFAVSPDGKWIAYKHLHDAYVAAMPLPGTGTLELGDSDGGLKVYALTKEMADWLHWQDARTLTWTAANELHRTTIDDVIARAEAEKEKAKEKEKAEQEKKDDAEAVEEAPAVPDPLAPQVTTITLTVPRAKPQGTLVIDGARLITMKGDEVIENGRLVIEGERITAVGPAADVAIPAGAKVIDARGKTAIPGLVNAHAHMGYNSMDVLPQRDWQYYVNLAYGVTATMDPSASTHLVFAQGEMVEAGVMKGPRVYSTGFILYGADIAGRAPTNSYEDAVRHVQRMKKYGAFAIKSYMQPKRIQRQWYVQACRELEMLNFPEGGGNFENNMGMILDGHSGIEHTTPVAPLYEDVLHMWSRTKVGYTPTFLVAYGGISGENWFYQNAGPAWADAKLTRFTPRAVIESRSRRLSSHAYEGDYFHMIVAASANELLKRGVLVNLGEHGQRQGLGAHWDLWALSHGGTSNHDVLRAGTIFPATYIGLGSLLGSLEEGKLADVVLLEGNPLEDIRNTNTVSHTIKHGELFDASTMDQLWPVEQKRAPFLFESSAVRP
jgi:Tol biopolymer transport system component/imidazolonepropionase-like amidohydrolase